MYLPTYRKHNRIWLFVVLLLLFLTRSIQLPEIRAQQKPDLRENGFYVMRLPQIGKAKEYHSPKKGLAAVYPQCEDAQRLGVSWYHNWSTRPGFCEGVETIPMLWCQTDGEVDAASGWLLLFNEPNEHDQCNKTVEQVVEMEYQVENNPRYDGLRLVSPAYSHKNPNDLERVWNGYRARYGAYPRWSAIAFHCYTETRPGLELCKQHLANYSRLANEWNAELWLTEFAVVRGKVSDVDALAMEREWIDLLEHNRLVMRYAYFTNRVEDGHYTNYRLINNDGSFNAFGVLYRGY